MSGLRYGGETEAIFVVEVYRKREDTDLDESERAYHENTVTVNVAKNKRPPCRVGEHDLFIDGKTGRIRSIMPGDHISGRSDTNTQLDEIRRQEATRAQAFGTQLGAF